MDAISQPEVENKFPDCVVMKLHVRAKPEASKESPSLQLSRTFGLSKTQVKVPPKEIDISLTINFSGEQKIVIPGGTRLGLPGGLATFGVRRGELRFVLRNCKLPLEKISLLKPFKVSVPVETHKTRSTEFQASAEFQTGTSSKSPSAGMKVTKGTSEKITEEVSQVKETGSEDKPGWIFEAYDERKILEGMLKETPLGTLQIDEIPCEIATDFMARSEDVRITWGKIGQVENIHRNKLAVIERAIVLRHIKPMVEAAPICQGRWRHG